MRLFEVFKKSDLDKYTYTIVSSSLFKEVSEFTLPDGQRFIVSFKMLTSPESEKIHDILMNYVKIPQRLNDPAIQEQIRKTLGGIYYVTFQDADKPEGDFEQTNKNKDMFLIFGHVIKIMIDFAAKRKILELSFSAEGDELSRIKFYDRLAVVIPQTSNLKLLEIDRDPSLTSYMFTHM